MKQIEPINIWKNGESQEVNLLNKQKKDENN